MLREGGCEEVAEIAKSEQMVLTVVMVRMMTTGMTGILMMGEARLDGGVNVSWWMTGAKDLTIRADGTGGEILGG